jgi:nitrogen fixation protein FixH
MSSHLRSSIAAVIAIASILLVGTACSDDRSASSAAPAATAKARGLEIAFRTLSSPTSGDNKVEAVVKEADGKPVTDADVSVTFRMPAMPSMNMPEMHSTTSLAHEGAGRYVGTGQLEMTGSWNVTVTVSRNGAQIGNQRFSLIAK